MSGLSGYLAEHAAPGRHSIATNPLTQLEAIRGMCARAGHTGDGDIVEAVADAITELLLLRDARAVEDDPILRMVCSICGQRAQYGERWNAAADAHSVCAAAMPSEAELSSDEWRR